MKSRLRRPLQLQGLIVLLYVVLASWWVYFFEHESELLVRQMAAAGAALSPEQVSRLQDLTARHGRMFFGESGFMALLMVVSTWLVVRALRRERLIAQQQQNFLSAVTHELKSPIASARLYLESLQLGRADAEKVGRYLRHAHEDLTRLQGLVENLLEGRRLQHTGAELQREAVDLTALVSGLLERMGPVHGAGGRIRLAAPAPVPVLADAAALQRVVDNLLSNAVKYGGAAGEVDVVVSAADGRALLTVRDRGPGLRGADPEEIFEPFVRGGDEAVRTQQGVGLGLYIVRELVVAHGGTVTARDGLPGGGTEMRVELPLHRPGETGGAGESHA